jgi:predicted nucleotidyltransferase
VSTGISLPVNERDESLDRLLEALRGAVTALRDEEVDFLLGGSLASWARGGPSTDHDVDLFVREGDAERAAEALAAAGFEVERPAEGWLVKAWRDGVLVDVIFHPSSGAIDDDVFARAEEMEVDAVRLRVASLEDVLAAKLLGLNEQDLDLGPSLEVARALREQIDWEAVEARTSGSPYARAFIFLARQLEIAPA